MTTTLNRTLKITSLIVMTAILLTTAMAQGRQRQKLSSGSGDKAAAEAKGGNTPGRIARFKTAGAVTDSNITEDAASKIGIGTTLPTSPLTVKGVIEANGSASSNEARELRARLLTIQCEERRGCPLSDQFEIQREEDRRRD